MLVGVRITVTAITIVISTAISSRWSPVFEDGGRRVQ
jgi:hypothetical protein